MTVMSHPDLQDASAIQASSSPDRPSLQIRALRKAYQATVALDGVDLDARPGEVHALLGENGAGKSTLVKILSGLVRPDTGTVSLEGQDVPFGQPRFSRSHGIRTAFQEMSLVRDLTVAQNFFLGEEPLGIFGLVRQRDLIARVAEEFARLGITSVDPRTPVSDLDLSAKQKVEIAKAVSRKPKVLLLDEPTASLSARDVDWLGGLIQQAKLRGAAVIFISHRMREVRDFCSMLTILRNGRSVGTHALSEITDEEVIKATVGRSLHAVHHHRDRAAGATSEQHPLLETSDLVQGGSLQGVSLSLRPGSIVGVSGLEGMGQRDLFLTLFGIGEPSGGQIEIGGRPVRISSPAEAISAGIGLVPEDRKTEGLFLALDGRENAALPSLDRFAKWGLIQKSREEAAVARAFQAVQVSADALWRGSGEFSGGNQQKIVLAKWLLSGNRVLLLYDPTRGVDVGTKAEIYELMGRFVQAGGAILFYSTEIPELVNLCDEVLVLYRGRVIRRLVGDEITETAILRSALGEPSAAEETHVGH